MEKEKKISRRGFLGAGALASCAGYSVFIDAGKLLASENGGIKEKAFGKYKIPPREQGADKSFPLKGEAVMQMAELECDVLVAGGGLSGVCAAISAARKGRSVILVHNRSRLGGNASSEIKMHPLGVNSKKTGWREGGVVEEILLENSVSNPEFEWDMWDFLLYNKCVSEKNLKLILDTDVVGAQKSGDKIVSVTARCDLTWTLYKISAKIFVDSTGDSRLGFEAGAEMMSGREGKEKFGESRGNFDEVGTRQGSSIMFVSKLYDKPMPFTPPPWAKKVTESDLKFRNINSDNLGFGYWWLEMGGLCDAVRDNEHLRFEILSILMGVWDYIKNSGKFPEAENRALSSVGMLPGKRDTFRIVGEKILTQKDVQGDWKNFDDAVAVGGWQLDDHPASGFLAKDRHPGTEEHNDPSSFVDPYNIPFSIFYSKDVKNLMMAGRNISCSHVAFGSTRVMLTCASGAHAVGVAAAMCAESGITPSQLRANPEKMSALQQYLLREDQTILNVKNLAELDTAKFAKASASSSVKGSKPENVFSGVNIDSPKKSENKWIANIEEKPWLLLEFSKPCKLSELRIVFDSGTAELTQSYRAPRRRRMISGPQPSIVKDYSVVALLSGGGEKVLFDVKGNAKKLVVHKFDKLEASAIRIKITSTNGGKYAIIKGISLS